MIEITDAVDMDTIIEERCPECGGMLDAGDFWTDDREEGLLETTDFKCVSCNTWFTVEVLYVMKKMRIYRGERE